MNARNLCRSAAVEAEAREPVVRDFHRRRHGPPTEFVRRLSLGTEACVRVTIGAFLLVVAALFGAASASGLAAQQSPTTTSNSAAVRPKEPATVLVQVVDESGAPIPDAIATTPPHAAGDRRAPIGEPGTELVCDEAGAARTRADGSLVVRGSGVRWIGVEASGRASTFGRIDFDAAHETAVVRFVLGRAATLRWTPVGDAPLGADFTVRFMPADVRIEDKEIGASPRLRTLRPGVWQPEGAGYPLRWRTAALAAPYVAVLHDRFGPVPGYSVEVPPLVAGEDRCVSVPVPESTGVVRARVLSIDGSPAVGREVAYGVAPETDEGRIYAPRFDLTPARTAGDGVAWLRDLRNAPLDLWVIDATAGWGLIRTTPASWDERKVVEMRLRPTRLIRLQWTTRFGVLSTWRTTVLGPAGTPAPWIHAPYEPSQIRRRSDATLCPSDAITVRARYCGRSITARIPEGAPFGREERSESVPGVGELVVRSAAGREPGPVVVRPVRVDGVDEWLPPLDAPSFVDAWQTRDAGASAGEIRRPLWPGVWSVRAATGETVEVTVKADESAVVTVP